MRWFIWGKGAVQSPLLQKAEVTDAAVEAALHYGHSFDTPEAWAVEIEAEEADIDAATRFDPAIAGYEAADTYFAQVVREKLGLQPDELEALFGALPSPKAGGPDGRLVAAEIRQRFNLPEERPLGTALQERGILTAAEAEWLDDEE